jgi:uncharacterized Rmd1/YagE family protein
MRSGLAHGLPHARASVSELSTRILGASTSSLSARFLSAQPVSVSQTQPSQEESWGLAEFPLTLRSYFLAKAVDLHSFARDEALQPYSRVLSDRCFVLKGEPSRTRRGDVEAHAPEAAQRSMLVFPFGGVVFMNMSESEQRMLLQVAAQYTSDPKAYEAYKEFKDAYRVVVRPGMRSWSSGGRDMVAVKQLDDHTLEIIARVLAQSVALANSLTKVDRIFERAYFIWEHLARTGQFDMPRSQLFKLVAEINMAHTEVFTNLQFFDRHEVVWENPHYDDLRELLWHEFELRNRLTDVSEKVDACTQQLRFCLETLQNRKSDALEWTIIVLIGLEICVR